VRVDAAVLPRSSETELKTNETRTNLEPAVASYQQPEANDNTEVLAYQQQDGMSSDSVYQEIQESENTVEQPTSEGDLQEATSEYEDLDPVAVAELRARPPPVYDHLNGRNGH